MKTLGQWLLTEGPFVAGVIAEVEKMYNHADTPENIHRVAFILQRIPDRLHKRAKEIEQEMKSR